MVVKKYILANLKELDAAYRTATNHKQGLYMSKLAVLELCGWIELSMDDLIDCHARRRIRLLSNSKFVSDQIIKKNYGFDYKRNFRNMVMRTVGIVSCEAMERHIPTSILVRFEAQLENLKISRNNLAHTFLSGS